MATSPLQTWIFTKLGGPESIWIWKDLEEVEEYHQNIVNEILKKKKLVKISRKTTIFIR